MSDPERRIPGIYTAAAAILGLIYLIVLAPWATNDSASHFAECYRYSNIILGQDEWSARASDASVYSDVWKVWTLDLTPDPERGDLTEIAESFSFFCADKSSVPYPNKADFMDFYNILNYLPLVTGIVIARLMGLGFWPTVYLGRLIQGAFLIFLTRRAIKTIPCGKTVLAMTALLPIVLQELTAYGYGGVLFAVIMNFTACTLRIYMQKGSIPSSLTVESIIWSILLGAVKGGAGLPFLILGFSLLSPRQGKKKILIFAGMLAAAFVSVFVSDVLLQDPDRTFFQVKQYIDCYDTSLALLHPIVYLRLWSNTIVRQFFSLFAGAFGRDLGWSSPLVPSIIIISFIILINLAGLSDASVRMMKDRKISASAFITFLVMILKDTPVWLDYIDRVQGRYFTPAIPIGVMSVMSFFSREGREKMLSLSFGLFLMTDAAAAVFLLCAYVL